MVDITLEDIRAASLGKQHQQFDLVRFGVNAWEITRNLYPARNNLEVIYQDIQHSLGHHDWTKSFVRSQIIYTSQELTPWVLESLHSWLRTQSGNIENIVLITTNCLGLESWWQRLKQLQGERSFRIIEWLDIDSLEFRHYYQCLENLCDADTVLADRTQLNYFFSWYGGHRDLDKFFRSLRMLELYDHGIIEILEDYEIDQQQIVNHVEYLSYFQNSQEVDTVKKLYNTHIDHHTKKFRCRSSPATVGVKQHNESIDFEGYQYSINRQCFASVVRETTDCWQFSTVTEKTLRGFIHHMAVIPAGYQTVNNLEKFGFWFPHDLVDYNYQWEKDYLKRFVGMIDSIKKTVLQHSMVDINRYYQDNFQRFRHNAELCVKFYRGQK